LKRVKAWVFLFVLFMSISSFSHALNPEFTGYLRGGTGLNLVGGQQECFYNVGIPGNFLRLGNECGFYSELAAAFIHQTNEQAAGPYFKTQIRWMFSAKGTRQWEKTTDRDISAIEAFVQAGKFAEVPGEYWVGKRFYRDVDLAIFDWYYFADMSGVGAGVEGLPLGPGTFSLAHLIQANDSLTTSVGKPVLQALDLRWKNLPVGHQRLDLWGVYAWAPASHDASTQYVASQGSSLASKFYGSWGEGHNTLSFLYGQGAMKDLNIYGSSAVPATDSGANRAWTLRVVEDWKKDVTDTWALMLALAAEVGDNGTPTKKHREWQGVGVRPLYYVTDRFQWVFEAGYTRLRNEAEVDGNGKAVGERGLGRITLAPQLSFGKGIWSRPVLRAYLSHSFWTASNRSYVASAAPSVAEKNAGTSLGYQFEAWF